MAQISNPTTLTETQQLRTWKWMGLEDFLVSFWGIFFGLFSGANWLWVAGRVEIFDSQCFGGSVAQSSTELFGP